MEQKIELWTPWEWEEITYSALGVEPQGTTIMQASGHYICHQRNIRPIEQRQEIATCICLAVNETYGRGLNPEVIKDLIDNLEDAIIQMRYLHDKFMPTGSGNAVISRCESALAKAKL